MPLVSGLPIVSIGPWSNTIPDGITNLFTTWNLDESDALASDPTPDTAWANRGTLIRPGISRVTYVHAMPATAAMRPFDGKREYHQMGAVARTVDPAPQELSFTMPMVWLDGDVGWRLVNVVNGGSMVDVLGAMGSGLNGIPRYYVMSGRYEKAQHVANLFYTSMYVSSHGMTAPTQFTYPQPGNPDGIALFTDGTGAAGSGGDDHYANPAFAGGARFVNAFPAYGTFLANVGRSISQATMVPNALFPAVRANSSVTDIIGGTAMQEKFWNMMVQTLSAQVFMDVTGIAAASTTNPFSAEAALRAAGITQDNFIGRAFGPKTYWIAPQLDSHPYLVANPGKDMWITLSVGAQDGVDLTWAKGAANNIECVPMFRFYGPGDAQAQGSRQARWEGDLDIKFEPGAPNKVAVFFET